MSLPDEVVVSIFSVRLFKPTPFSCSRDTVSIRCFKERPRRSSFQTTSVSPGRTKARAWFRASRSALAPLILSVKYLVQSAFLSASCCRSAFCSSVETRLYPTSTGRLLWVTDQILQLQLAGLGGIESAPRRLDVYPTLEEGLRLPGL